MKLVNTRDAVGHVLCHDITKIVPNEFKGAAFRKGHVVREEDVVDVERLREVNNLGRMMIATRMSYTPIRAGDKLAGMRVIPLVIEYSAMEEARKVAGNGPLLSLYPYRKLKVGVITTGSEVLNGRIQDASKRLTTRRCVSLK